MISHMGLASATKTPELVLDDRESKALADATANVMAEFDMRPDPKFIAVAGLVTTAVSVYGPRMILINHRKAKAKEERKMSMPENVKQFDPNGDADVTFPPGMLGGGAGRTR